jgi:hypothetical protein
MEGKRLWILAFGLVALIAATALSPGWLRGGVILAGIILMACGLWLSRRMVKEAA